MNLQVGFHLSHHADFVRHSTDAWGNHDCWRTVQLHTSMKTKSADMVSILDSIPQNDCYLASLVWVFLALLCLHVIPYNWYWLTKLSFISSLRSTLEDLFCPLSQTGTRMAIHLLVYPHNTSEGLSFGRISCLTVESLSSLGSLSSQYCGMTLFVTMSK